MNTSVVQRRCMICSKSVASRGHASRSKRSNQQTNEPQYRSIWGNWSTDAALHPHAIACIPTHPHAIAYISTHPHAMIFELIPQVMDTRPRQISSYPTSMRTWVPAACKVRRSKEQDWNNDIEFRRPLELNSRLLLVNIDKLVELTRVYSLDSNT